MVLVQRRRSSPTIVKTECPELRRGSLFVSMGDGRDSPVQRQWLSCQHNNDSSAWSFTASSSKSKSYIMDGSNKNRSWIVKLVYTLAALSWIIAMRSSSTEMLEALENQVDLQALQKSQTKGSLQAVQADIGRLNRQMKKAKRAKQALEHEIRMLQEIPDEEQTFSIAGGKTEKGSVLKWMNRRKSALQRRIEILQHYLSEQSRRQVIERYGPGPHKVKLTVEFTNGKRNDYRSFVVELASVDEMPYSIHLFLDMVDGKLWDNTIFLHHQEVDHVLAAALLDADSHKVKFNQMHSLGWDGLGFPEYSLNYSHKKYTVGYADQGPTFYINVIDNVEAHGPGGQGHHKLPGDADPCFGKIVEGFEVVEALNLYGFQQNRMSQDALHPWADDKHSWTRIVKAEIL